MKDTFPDTEPVLFREPFRRKCELLAQIKELRELNAELLMVLKALLETRCAEPEARAIIAKAEKL
jgi:hypothetical protein